MTKSKGRRLKELMQQGDLIMSPGVYDGFSAHLAEKMGFKTGVIGGSGISESRLGRPDRGIMGYEEVVRACRNLADCTDLLLQGDADTGYGNAVNVYFTVRGFEDAGLAMIALEDQVWPKRCGHMKGKKVIPAEEMVQKIKAATDARRDQDFQIKARTDSMATHGINEVIDRLGLYAEAGADVVMADALTSREGIEKVAASVSKPLAVNMGFGIRSRSTTPLMHPKELKALGVAQVTYPRLLTASALRGMMNGMTAFLDMVKSDAVPDRQDLLASFEEINELMGEPELNEMEARWA
ncbi:isocitrate lyase/PEP mutase family protein [Agaricicola taiwanensis]|nr:isocitrate lyase/PEP mutase family protein [Agaricicola taiwanensis]